MAAECSLAVTSMWQSHVQRSHAVRERLRHSMPARFAISATVMMLIAVGTAHAQTQLIINSHAIEIGIHGRIHSQFSSSSVAGANSTDLFTRRARLTLDIKVNDFVSGRVEPDFAGSASLRNAWVRLTFGSGFRATIGQFKRAFDLFELTSSTRTLVIERDGRIPGLNACTGPNGTCSYGRLSNKLGFASYDVGLLIDGTDQTRKFSYSFAFTNGAGPNQADENDSKSVSGRARYEVASDVKIGANISIHDYINPVLSENKHAIGLGGDVEVGNFENGFHLQAGVIGGQNWQNLDIQGDEGTFVAAQGIVTYRAPVRNQKYVNGIEPLLRVSWAYPDTGRDRDDGVLVTPGVMVHFIGRNKIALNMDVWAPNQGDTEVSLKIQSYLYF